MDEREIDEMRWLLHCKLAGEAKTTPSCTGKEHFITYALAQKVNRLRAKSTGLRTVYRCPFCTDYHIAGAELERGKRIDNQHRKDQR